MRVLQSISGDSSSVSSVDPIIRPYVRKNIIRDSDEDEGSDDEIIILDHHPPL